MKKRLFNERVKVTASATPELLAELQKYGIVQRELASHLALSAQYVNDVVKGRRECSLGTARMILEYIESVKSDLAVKP